MIVPEGKIATGKLAQALMHGARVVALRGNFDQALKLVRELVEKHPIALVNSVNDYRIEGQKTGAFEVCDELGEPPDVLAIPVGNAGNITSWWRGFAEWAQRRRARGCTATRPRGPRRSCTGAGREPGDRRVGDPHRQPGALGGGDERRHRLARRDPRGDRRRDPGGLRAARRGEGVFCEPASAASVAGVLKHGGPPVRAWCAC